MDNEYVDRCESGPISELNVLFGQIRTTAKVEFMMQGTYLGTCVFPGIL